MADRETITELKKRLAGVKDAAALRAEFAAENDHEDGARAGALDALNARAKEIGASDADLAPLAGEKPKATTQAETAPGAQPATGEASEEERESHEARIARLEELAASSAGNPAGVPDGKDFDARESLLKVFRQIEHIANQLNISLPQ